MYLVIVCFPKSYLSPRSGQGFFSRNPIFAFFLPSFSGGCPQVSKKADLTRLPRRRARQALPLRDFLLLTGWPFTKNVELQCVSSPLRGSLAPARRPHPPRLRNCRLVKEKCKNFKELFNSNGRSGCTQLGLLQIVQSGH
jgi:hypothetical protein